MKLSEYTNNIANKITWIAMGILLYLPFLIELFAYPLFLKIHPDWLAHTLFFIFYTYLFYGLAIIIYSRWRKKIAEPLSWKPDKAKYLLIAIIVGVLFRRIELLAMGGAQTPMIIWQIIGYLEFEPLWMGIAGYAIQFIYYLFEFILAACIVDCMQTAAEKFSFNKLVPWGGIFLALTWGMEHALTKGTLINGLWCAALSLVIGIVYNLTGKKPVYAFAVITAAYLL